MGFCRTTHSPVSLGSGTSSVMADASVTRIGRKLRDTARTIGACSGGGAWWQADAPSNMAAPARIRVGRQDETMTIFRERIVVRPRHRECNGPIRCRSDPTGGRGGVASASSSSRTARRIAMELDGIVRAPDFPAALDWLHTGGKQLTLADFRGRLLLLDFWTYG